MKLSHDDRNRIIQALSERAGNLRILASGRRESQRDELQTEAKYLDDLATTMNNEEIYIGR